MSLSLIRAFFDQAHNRPTFLSQAVKGYRLQLSSYALYAIFQFVHEQCIISLRQADMHAVVYTEELMHSDGFKLLLRTGARIRYTACILIGC